MIDCQAYPAVEEIIQVFKLEIYSISGKGRGLISQVKQF